MDLEEEEDVKMKDNKHIENKAVRAERTEEERDKHRRVMMNMNYDDKLYIDPSIIPDDVDYYWVRVTIRGEPDTSRMVQMQRKGWTAVPASRHPELAIPDFFGRLDKFSEYIHQDGLVLCERPKEYGREENKIIEEKNYQILTQMPGTENFMGEPNIPTKFTGDTYLTKAASFGR